MTSATAADPPDGQQDHGRWRDPGHRRGSERQVAYANPVDSPQNVGTDPGPGGTPQKFELLNTDPFGVTFGQDGAYWISRFQGNDLLRLTTAGQITMLGGFSPAAGPRKIATGPGNTLWTTLDRPTRSGA